MAMHTFDNNFVFKKTPLYHISVLNHGDQDKTNQLSPTIFNMLKFEL